MDIILNTTVLSNFTSVDALNLIKRLFGVVYTTHEVHKEILRGISRGYQENEDAEQSPGFRVITVISVLLLVCHPRFRL